MAHAALDAFLAHPDAVGDWHASSNTLVVLAAPDELALVRLAADAAEHLLAAVHEPDLDGALTALALAPSATRGLGRLPLALSGTRTAETAAASVRRRSSLGGEVRDT